MARRTRSRGPIAEGGPKQTLLREKKVLPLRYQFATAQQRFATAHQNAPNRSLPILGRPFLPDEIPWLHTLLETWGYYNDLPKFVEDFHRDYHHTRTNPSVLAAWVRAKDDWMTQGDIILELIEDYLVVDILEHRQGDNLRRMWKGLTEVVFEFSGS
ncbi:hypothetical protein A0H81_12439 [Grifola frondosa]|uniref:Uncharacterized protein n=1 Tax=Grifola frondosa TaxID=5627 RepID=A0A1C7LSJ7_GRIFR|nr:hypothetical protein A0H81_12439 [Grifola frondosa]